MYVVIINYIKILVMKILLYIFFLLPLFLQAQNYKMYCYSEFFKVKYNTRANYLSAKSIIDSNLITAIYEYPDTAAYDDYDTKVLNTLAVRADDNNYINCIIYAYDSINAVLNISYAENPHSKYWLPELANKSGTYKMQRIGYTILDIHGKKYAAWMYENHVNKANSATYSQFFISKKSNIILQTLYYNTDGTINDNTSLIIHKKLAFRCCYGPIHIPLDTANTSVNYEVTSPKIYGKPMQSSFLLSRYPKFVKKNDAIYRQMVTSDGKQKFIPYYPLTSHSIRRDYPSVYHVVNTDTLLPKKNPLHNSLIISYLGIDSVDHRMCYHFKEEPDLSLDTFTKKPFVKMAETWIDAETLLPYKRIVWYADITQKKAPLKWIISSQMEFIRLNRDDFFIEEDIDKCYQRY